MKKKVRDHTILLLHKLIARLRYGNLRKRYNDDNHALMGWGDWGSDLVRAFGEDPASTCGFTLDIPVDDAVTVTVQRYLSLDEIATATEIIRKYAWKELSPVKE